MEFQRRANLELPKTIDEARRRLVETSGEIRALQTAIDARFRYREDDGMPMGSEEHFEWRRKARGAMEWFVRERTMLEMWLKDYEREVKAEQDDERRRQKQETKVRHAQEQRARQTERHEWTERMLKEHGTVRAPKHVLKEREIELEKLRAENHERYLSILAAGERAHRRKQSHREWLKRLEIEEPVNGLDPDNLLKHALQLLRRLREEGRVEYTWDEKTVLDVIEQRFLILADLVDDSNVT